MNSERDFKEIIEAFIYDFPICEFHYLNFEELMFSDKVRTICEQGCTRYNKSWACPPAIRPVDVCMKECASYEHIFLFTSVAEVSDNLNFSACLEAKRSHESMTFEIRARFEEQFGKVLALSTGCMICDECAYPNAPCRHPEERLSTIESHGILIMETASQLGVCLDCGNNIVTYISLIFFNA